MYSFFKRVFDLTLSVTLILVLSPLFILLTLILYFEFKNPFFFQIRPGKNEKLFRVIKFKTMNNDKDINGILLSDNQRLTTLGNFIRKTSLDELPQLFNVVKGDMSIVGPRPLLVEYLNLYTERQKKRHLVKPGITGWAQINGRNAITWDEKFEHDLYYVDNKNFSLDLKIIIKTIAKVFFSEGISENGQVTMTKFKGSRDES